MRRRAPCRGTRARPRSRRLPWSSSRPSWSPPPSAHAGRAAAPEAILDPHPVDRDEGLRQRVPCEEADPRHLARRLDLARLARQRLEAEVHGVEPALVRVLDHLARRVGVDADQPPHLHAPAGLLAHLARRRVRHRLARLEVAARQAPVAVVAPLHQQDLAPTRLAAHDGGDREAHLGRGLGEVARQARARRTGRGAALVVESIRWLWDTHPLRVCFGISSVEVGGRQTARLEPSFWTGAEWSYGASGASRRPVSSGSPRIRFAHCTAWPLAPFTRLSSAERRTSVPLRSSAKAATSQKLLPRTEARRGVSPSGSTRTKRSPSYAEARTSRAAAAERGRRGRA